LAVTLGSFLFSYYQVRGGKRNLRKDVERRAAVLAESLAGHVEPELEKGSIKKLQGIVERFSNRERLARVAVVDRNWSPAHNPPDSLSGCKHVGVMRIDWQSSRTDKLASVAAT